MPRFSVIIPNYNHAPFLEQRIRSVLEQSFADFELIILDDHSTDNSADIIHKYREHPLVSQVIINETNSGSPFRQWQKGIQIAKAEWIWIAESDDFADKHFLKTADIVLQDDDRTTLFYTDAAMVDAAGQPIPPGYFSEIKNKFFGTDKWSDSYGQTGIDELNEYLQLICEVNNAGSAVMKKEALLPFLGELATYQYHGDWFCYIKLALAGNIAYAADKANFVRIHPESQLNRDRSQQKSKLEHFSILLLLLQQKEISDKKKIIRFFCEQYINVGLRHNGFGGSISIIFSYFRKSFFTAWRVLFHILLIKLTRRKVKPIF